MKIYDRDDLERDWEWFLSDVKFLGKFTRIFIIGNNLGANCIIERIFLNPKELGFKIMRTPIIHETKATWPAKYNPKEIEKEKESYRKIGKINIWLQERMCVASAEENRIFNGCERA